MAMNVRYGQFTNETSDDFLVPINFPTLMQMDEWTPDGRRFQSAGGGVRPLPWSIKAQFETLPGHMEATVVGVVQEVEFHDNGKVSGKGWLVNVPEAHKAALFVRTGALRRNSVDIADVTYTADWKSDDPASPDFWTLQLDFSEWNIATTTLVDIPAFPTATAGDEEITASFVPVDGEVLTIEFEDTVAVFDEPAFDEEIVADGAIVQSYADFHLPEPDKLTPITVTPDGCVFFHLAAWGKPHRGVQGRHVFAPRPANYGSFHASSVLTERGEVGTGPVFFLGGHPDNPIGSTRNAMAAYGGVENSWADVRVTNGRLGPWACGRVRPGVSEESIYAARASRLSGHWVGQDLAAIVSCNVPGYDVARDEIAASMLFPDSTLSPLRDGAIVHDGEIVELVASLPVDLDERREALKDHLIRQVVDRHNTTTLTVVNDGNLRLSIDDPMVAEALDRINNGESCKAVSKHKTATSDKSWDGPANEKKLPSPMKTATARKAYAWMDDDAVEDGEIPKSGCKFIHHEVSADGTPGAANLTACSAGIAVLNGGRGGANIPDSDRQGVYNHLAKHLTDGDKEPPELMSIADVEALTLEAEALQLQLELEAEIAELSFGT